MLAYINRRVYLANREFLCRSAIFALSITLSTARSRRCVFLSKLADVLLCVVVVAIQLATGQNTSNQGSFGNQRLNSGNTSNQGSFGNQRLNRGNVIDRDAMLFVGY